VLLPSAAPSVLLAALIIKEPDLGTAVACMAITTAVLYIAGMKMRYLGYGLLASLLPLYFLIVRVPWRWNRIIAFLDPWKDPQGHGFHIIQSMIAVSTGGLMGAGLMEGKQKLFYLPEPHTDFIYANIAEELGLWGAALVVILFSIFLYRGIRTALRTQDPFARFLATGITAMVVVQALINMSVVLGMMPTKGIPLPFVSYGGSSLFITLASVGILLNITQQTD
jgi:cell division protein FtsW